MAEPHGEPWQPGDDDPAYVWLCNKGGEADKLVGASTPKAEQGKAHLVLRGVRQLIRGGDFMKFTLRFENAGSITFNIQSQIPAYDESPSPPR